MSHPVLVAYHEAGHAVAAAALGVPVLYAALTPHVPERPGVVAHGAAPDELLLLVALAGPAATAVVRPWWEPEDGSAGDERDALAIARRLAPRDPHALVRATRPLARDLVTHPPHWLAVARVADELFDAGRVDGARVSEVLAEVLADPLGELDGAMELAGWAAGGRLPLAPLSLGIDAPGERARSPAIRRPPGFPKA